MRPINSWILFCLISLLSLFGILTTFCDASEQVTNCLEYRLAGADGGLTTRVLWTVSTYHIGKNALWGKTEAERMLFKPLDITASTITFNGQTCHDLIFKRKIVDATLYLAEKYQTKPKDLGCEGETLELIKTNCSIPGFSEYMRLKERKLIISIKGVLFVFEPAVNY